MQVKSLKHFISPRYGEVRGGQVKDIPEKDARRMIEAGMVEEYETKVIRDQPRTPNRDVPSDAGAESESSSSPAVRRSRKKTARRSRARESSSSTEQSD